MREVRTCDFCDEAAAGTFEVVPPERDPGGEGRRMVLCPDCRDTLGSVLEPLLGAEGDADHDTPPSEGTGTTAVVAEPERERGGAETESGPGGGSVGGPGPEAPDAGPSVDGDSPATGDTGGNAGEDHAGESAPGEGPPEEAGGRSRSARRGTPRGYRKVMRFLENREFPMDREEAETLAAEAYGMDRASVSAAIDHAIKHNRVREASGDLHQ
jgi:hypothetical protein